MYDFIHYLYKQHIWCVFVYSIGNKVKIPNTDGTTTAAVQYTAGHDDNGNSQQQTQTPAQAVCIRDQPRVQTTSSSLRNKV